MSQPKEFLHKEFSRQRGWRLETANYTHKEFSSQDAIPSPFGHASALTALGPHRRLGATHTQVAAAAAPNDRLEEGRTWTSPHRHRAMEAPGGGDAPPAHVCAAPLLKPCRLHDHALLSLLASKARHSLRKRERLKSVRTKVGKQGWPCTLHRSLSGANDLLHASLNQDILDRPRETRKHCASVPDPGDFSYLMPCPTNARKPSRRVRFSDRRHRAVVSPIP